jgi:hypothetical protein
MGIELRHTCLNRKPSQSTRQPPGVSGTSRTSGNLASDRPDWVGISPRTSADGTMIRALRGAGGLRTLLGQSRRPGADSRAPRSD